MYPFCSKNVFKNALGMLILTVDGKKVSDEEVHELYNQQVCSTFSY